MHRTMLAALLCYASVAGAVPPSMHYTGRLFDSAGQPFDGPVDVVVRLYDASSGGALLFEETFADDRAVEVRQGYLSMLIANNEVSSVGLDELAATNDELYMELEVDGDLLTPRQQLGAVPWALAAGNTRTDTLGELDCPDGGIARRSGGAWVCGVEGDILADLDCAAAGEVAKWDGARWICAPDAAGPTTLPWLAIDDVPPGLVDLGAAPQTACGVDELLRWDGARWSCTASSAVLDPGIGVLMPGKLCTTDGSSIDCTQEPAGLIEEDPLFAASVAAGIGSAEVGQWNQAYAWGDHVAAGYLTDESDPLFGASVAAGITAGQVASWNNAAGWGNHAAAGYLVTEADPQVGTLTGGRWCAANAGGTALDCTQAPPVTAELDPAFAAAPAAGITGAMVSQWNTAVGWGDHRAAGYVVAESDPQVGVLTGGRWCATNAAGTQVDCTQDPPLGSEADPQVGALTIGRWCVTNLAGTAVDCSQAAPVTVESDPAFVASVAASISAPDLGKWNTAYAWGDHAAAGYLTAEVDPRVGALAIGRWCVTNAAGTGVECTQTAPVTSEADPQVATLTGGRWCTANAAGTAVTCTQTAPVTSEADPQVGTLTLGRWCVTNAGGTAVDCTQTAPVTVESDPSFAASVAASISAIDVGEWDSAYAWGNHAAAGYLTTEADPQVGALTLGRWCVTNAAGTGVDCTQTAPVTSEADPQVGALTLGRWCVTNAAGTAVDCTQTAPVTAESDPSFAASVAASISAADLGDWDTAYAWGNHAAAGYLTTEVDPQVGALTLGRWCVTNAAGTGVDCTQTAPVTSEADPQVGTLTANGWCAANPAGTALDCTRSAPLSSENDPLFVSSTAATITAAQIADWSAAYGWGNHAAAGYLQAGAEDDPQVGDVSIAGNWCRSNGWAVTCDAAPPPWQVSGPTVYYAAGNVSIGTSDNAATLDVRGSSGLVASFRGPTPGSVAISSSSVIANGGTGASLGAFSAQGTGFTTGQTRLVLGRSRGTMELPEDLVSGDTVATVEFYAASHRAAMIRARADGATGTGTPGRIELHTGTDTTDVREVMRIDSQGHVGVLTTDTSNILTVQQGSTTDPVADAWTVYSSRRWKTNIREVADAPALVDRLRGVRFDWRANGKPDVGFIAEEVGAVLPELVEFEPNGVDARSVDYARLTAVLVEALKVQQASQRRIEAHAQELEDRLAALERSASRSPTQLGSLLSDHLALLLVGVGLVVVRFRGRRLTTDRAGAAPPDAHRR